MRNRLQPTTKPLGDEGLCALGAFASIGFFVPEKDQGRGGKLTPWLAGRKW